MTRTLREALDARPRFIVAQAAILLLCSGGVASRVNAQSITGLGFLSGGNSSEATAVSADGLVVVGHATKLGSDRAFRWTSATGLRNLGLFPNATETQALAVNSDGTVITGKGWTTDEYGYTVFFAGFRWVSGSGMTSTVTMPGGSNCGWAVPIAVSADGNAMTGSCHGGAFRWTPAGGFVSLGVLPGCNRSSASGMTADGNVIIGSCDQPVRWTVALGLQALPAAPGIGPGSASAISADGSVIFGSERAGSISRVLRWGVSGPPQLVPGIESPFDTGVKGLSIDGSVAVGEQEPTPFLWMRPQGAVDPNSYLPRVGVDITGWTITKINGVSGDGRTIVGAGTHNGNTEAYAIHLPTPCHADADASGSIGVNDIFNFLQGWFASDPRTDLNGSETVTIQDVFDFLSAWFAGC